VGVVHTGASSSRGGVKCVWMRSFACAAARENKARRAVGTMVDVELQLACVGGRKDGSQPVTASIG
jgi:hypothetical protein